MSPLIYKVIHFGGIFTVFLALGGMMVHVLNGGTKGDLRCRKLCAISHGAGMFLVLLGGFGMIAKFGRAAPEMYSYTSGWVIGKLVIWVLLGAATMFIYRKPQMNRVFWFVLIALGVVAAWLGIYKPGVLPAGG